MTDEPTQETGGPRRSSRFRVPSDPDVSALVVEISRWIDCSPSYEGVDPEAVLWRRVTKVSSEANEARDALEGMVGENPRKGVTHTRADVIDELLDTAVAALGAVEHLTGHKGESFPLLHRKIVGVAVRAGLLQEVDRGPAA